MITSAAYADPSICFEIGRIPPAFIPIGNRRLFVHQSNLIKGHFDTVYISLPNGFSPPAKDLEVLGRLGFDTIFVPENLTLGQSVAYCLARLSCESIAILHGDTLFDDLDFEQHDGFTAHISSAPYQWASLPKNSEGLAAALETTIEVENRVLSGYFSFSSRQDLLQALQSSSGDFLAALKVYDSSRTLRPVDAGEWYDLGHFYTYCESKTRLTTERFFNGLSMDKRSVRKYSGDSFKMECEINWLRQLPDELSLYTPAFLGVHDNGDSATGYILERLMLSTLSDLFTFGRLPASAWKSVFEECGRFLEDCQRYRSEDLKAADVMNLYEPKTQARLDEVERSGRWPVDQEVTFNGEPMPSLRDLVRQTGKLITPLDEADIRLMHGDFCFSNIFYDTRSRCIKLVDPRGYVTNGRPTIYGDQRYDVAKLFHSAVGFYDLIIAGYYDLDIRGTDIHFLIEPDTYVWQVRDAFLGSRFGNINGDDPVLAAIAVQLFVSMLPLHQEDEKRQKAFIANAYRLYASLGK